MFFLFKYLILRRHSKPKAISETIKSLYIRSGRISILLFGVIFNKKKLI